MGTWSIVEGDGASITPDGLVTIPSLPSGSKTYKIKYISSDDGCECYHAITQSAVPPVGCTFTVYSDQNGASVSWRNGSTVVQTGTISMGSHSFNSTASGPLSVYLTKPGCTFPDNGEYCYCDDYVTIDGNCGGGGCSSYNYTYASTANIGCEGGTSVELAYTATCVDDASDWYTGKTTATISEIGCNSSTSTQTYTRTWNGHSITITQAKGDCCSTPGCTCSLDLDDDLSENGGTNVKVGTWSSTCSGTHGIKHVNGDDFLSSFDLKSNGDVYASFSANTGSPKTGTYALTGTGCYDNASAGQKGSSPGEDCTCSNFTVGSNITFGKNTDLIRTSTYLPTACTPIVDSKPNWITNVTASNGNISVTASTNDGDYKNDYVYFKLDGRTCSNVLGVSQYGGCSYTISSSIKPTDDQCESCDGEHYYPSKFDVKLTGFPTGGATATVEFSAVGGGNSNNCGTIARGTGSITMTTSDGTVSASQLGLGDLNKGVSSISITKITFSDESSCNYTTGGTSWSGSC